MNRSETDQKFLDEITNNLYPTIEQERPPLRIDIEGVGDQPAPEEVAPAPATAQAPVAPLAPADGAPSMTAYDPTVRERLAEFLQAGFESFGMERFQARRQAQSLIGGPSSNLPLQLGVADIVPFLGTGLQTEEAGRMLGDAADLAQQGDLGGAALNAAIGAVGLIPGAVGTVQAARKIGDIANVAGDKAVQAITGNPQATAMGVLEEAGQMSPLARIVPGVQPQAAPQRSDIGFYSAVEKAVLDSKQEKGTGAQFLAQITKTQGVKPEELKWTGLDEFLKGKKSVTKTEIQDYLNANRVDVREVRLSDEIDPEEVRMFMADEAGEGFTYDEAVDYLRDGDSVTKFSKYTLPGGENYREILLTLPFKEPKMPKGYEVSSMQYDDGTVRYFAETPTTRSAGYKTEAEAQSELQRMTEGLKDWRASQASYRSTHFDQPNILAHMRVNDRVVDGKKTLFIEEVQSDWHQAGRKKGYANTLPQGWTVTEAPGTGGTWVVRDANGEMVNQGASREDALSFALSGGSRVPDAPFKTSWHELTLKRAIQEASEKGYDQIAFTTGKTQAERYDLSKQIKTLIYSEPDAQGLRKVEAITPSGDRLLGKRYTLNEIEDNVGKEVAEKISKSSGEFDQRTGTYAMSGLDLQVGGEGMKGFYDQILPKSLEKLGKKFDAKVGKTFIEGERTRDADGFPSMYPEKVEVWKMDITPKMRETVTKQGQPLFQIGVGGGAAAGAATMQDNEERM